MDLLVEGTTLAERDERCDNQLQTQHFHGLKEMQFSALSWESLCCHVSRIT